MQCEVEVESGNSRKGRSGGEPKKEGAQEQDGTRGGVSVARSGGRWADGPGEGRAGGRMQRSGAADVHAIGCNGSGGGRITHGT